jgi:hypothetical protein
MPRPHAKNTSSRSNRTEQQFRENDAAQENRQDIIDDTTSGVQATLAQMRAEAKAAREASRPDDTGDSDREIEAAQADFDAAVERANNATAPSERTSILQRNDRTGISADDTTGDARTWRSRHP